MKAVAHKVLILYGYELFPNNSVPSKQITDGIQIYR